MIIKSFEIPKKKIDTYNIFLFYGQNEGLKKDLIQNIIEKKREKVKIHKYDESEIINNTDNFYNLIFSGSLFDNFKICSIDKVTDKFLLLIENVYEKKPTDILIFLIASNLEKKSKLRNFFEKDKNLVCVPCYSDTQIDLNNIFKNELKKAEIKISQESINLVINRADGDRQNLKNEIEKIKNYAHNKKTITVEEIRTLTNLSNNYQNEEIINVCLSGEKQRLKRMIEENNFSSEDFFILQKILNKKIHRLIKIKILQSTNKTDSVFNEIKPPIFWKEKEIVKKQTTMWSLVKLHEVTEKLNEVELNSKKNYEMGINITLDFLSSICFRANNSSL